MSKKKNGVIVWSAVSAAVVLGGAGSAALGADSFDCIVNSATSTVSYTGNANAPITGTMTGDTTATPPTRLKHGTLVFVIVQCGTWTATTNELINISGAIAASGSNSNIHPTGTFQLSIDPAAGTSSVNGVSLNLLGSSTATIAASMSNFRYETFCAQNPTCSVPFLVPITLPLGNVSITALTAVQNGGPATGTLTANAGGANMWDFSVPVTVDMTTTATFSGAPLPVTPQTLPMVLAGTITVTGNTATVTSTINLDLAPPPNTTPTDLPPTPFASPAGSQLCPGMNVTLALTVTSSTFTATSTANLAAAGTRITCACDWNHSGAVTVQDVFDYLTSYFGNAGDFNHDQATTLQDIFDFLTCFFSPPFGC